MSLLTELDLSSNRITHFPSSILSLPSLTSLNLNQNLITLIPLALTQLKALSILQIDPVRNIRNVPQEILLRGTQALREYFLDISEGGAEASYRMKIMFVGRAAAGKVSQDTSVSTPVSESPLSYQDKFDEVFARTLLLQREEEGFDCP